MPRYRSAPVWIGLLLGVLSGACQPTTTVPPDAHFECIDDTTCPGEQRCVVSLGVCRTPGEACVERDGDLLAAVQDGNACELAGGGEGICRTARCVETRCGDGFVDLRAGEVCDEGSENSDVRADACRSTCQPARCGDSVRDAGEGCDDGNETDEDACKNDCSPNVCGDRVLNPARETCDDGNRENEDACKNDCTENVCGDGVLNPAAEACDDGNDADADACTSTCTNAVCGDTIVWLGVEACDDGDDQDGGGCSRDCAKLEVCGDKVVDFGEACDDGNANPADGCDVAAGCVATEWVVSPILGSTTLASGLELVFPEGVFADRAGRLFVADAGGHRVYRVDLGTGSATIVAGTGVAGYLGDGVPAAGAPLNEPGGVVADGLGNIFIADTKNGRVRRVDGVTGVITTVAGDGGFGLSGDGGPATSASLNGPERLAIDGWGNLYFADSNNHVVRRVDASTGIITTVAGDGTFGFFGDGGPATSAKLAWPEGVALDRDGNLFIADSSNNRIRRVDASTGVISTVAGTGPTGDTGDGGPATSATLYNPKDVAVEADGTVLIADTFNFRIREVLPGSGIIRTRVGSGGTQAFAGDGGPAKDARLAEPYGLAVDPQGNVFIADRGNRRVREVAVATGTIDTAAGSGNAASGPRPGLQAGIRMPRGFAFDAQGTLLIADTWQERLVAYDSTSDRVSGVAGTGIGGFSGDGGPAIEATLNGPMDVVTDGQGNIYFTDSLNCRVRRIDGTTGEIGTIAGTDLAGYNGDNILAASADLYYPNGLAMDAGGDLYIADEWNHRVRRIDAATGVITTVAGNGMAGYTQDGSAATGARLENPTDVVVDTAGNLFIADRLNGAIRRVDAGTGIIETVAGTGTLGYGGDGGLATSADLNLPEGVAVTPAGVLYIADTDNHRIRRVDPTTGFIDTVVGTGVAGFSGDGGPATQATLNAPTRVVVTATGDLYLADTDNDVIRRVDAATGIITTEVGQIDPRGMGPVLQARLAAPVAMVGLPDMTLIAGGDTGTVQALRPAEARLEVVIGRYPHTPATGDLARFRDASFGAVHGVAYDPRDGVVYLSEYDAHTLHAVNLVDPGNEALWTIAALAGDGQPGHADGAAGTARFRGPTGLSFDEATRRLLVADTDGHVIRELDLSGAPVVSTVAGTPGALGYSGDGGVATAATLYGPRAVIRCGEDLFIADTGNNRVRRVDTAGVISTVLGDGVAASSGQGRPAREFPVNGPRGLACDGWGNLFVTSTTTVRMLVADELGVVDGTGEVQTLYGVSPRDTWPAAATGCLTDVEVQDPTTLRLVDSCSGLFLELRRLPLP